MAELRIAVGNGVEMRLESAQSVDLVLEGPLVAYVPPSPGPVPRCSWRCHRSIAVFRPDDPADVEEGRENERGFYQWTVPADRVTRFHNAVFVHVIGESGTQLSFTLPGDESVTLTLE
jgi:hypothetical protein